MFHTVCSACELPHLLVANHHVQCMCDRPGAICLVGYQQWAYDVSCLLYGFLCCALLVLVSVRFYGAGHSTLSDGYRQYMHAALAALVSRTVQAPGTCTVLLMAAAPEVAGDATAALLANKNT